MPLMIAVIVFLSSIVLIFSQEFARMIQKIAAIPGVKLFVPLALGSLIIEYYELWFLWFLTWCQAQLRDIMFIIASIMPFQFGAYQVIQITILFVLACLPAWFVWLMEKRKKMFTQVLSPYYVGHILWIIAVFLLITNPI